jgi:hypothetical protein
VPGSFDPTLGPTGSTSMISYYPSLLSNDSKNVNFSCVYQSGITGANFYLYAVSNQDIDRSNLVVSSSDPGGGLYGCTGIFIDPKTLYYTIPQNKDGEDFFYPGALYNVSYFWK